MKTWIRIDRSKLDPTRRPVIDLGIELDTQDELENINVSFNYTFIFPDTLFQHEQINQNTCQAQFQVSANLNAESPSFKFSAHVPYRHLPNRMDDAYEDYVDVLRDFVDYVIRLIEKRKPRRKQVFEEINTYDVVVKSGNGRNGRNILQIKARPDEVTAGQK